MDYLCVCARACLLCVVQFTFRRRNQAAGYLYSVNDENNVRYFSLLIGENGGVDLWYVYGSGDKPRQQSLRTLNGVVGFTDQSSPNEDVIELVVTGRLGKHKVTGKVVTEIMLSIDGTTFEEKQLDGVLQYCEECVESIGARVSTGQPPEKLRNSCLLAASFERTA